MLAAPAAMPPNPKIPAIIANIIKVTVQRNIVFVLRVINRLILYQRRLYKDACF